MQVSEQSLFHWLNQVLLRKFCNIDHNVPRTSANSRFTSVRCSLTFVALKRRLSNQEKKFDVHVVSRLLQPSVVFSFKHCVNNVTLHLPKWAFETVIYYTILFTYAENTHHLGKYHCTAGLKFHQFGFNGLTT